MDFDTISKGIDWAKTKGGVLKCDICFADIQDPEDTTNMVMGNKALTLCEVCFKKHGAKIMLSSLFKKASEEEGEGGDFCPQN